MNTSKQVNLMVGLLFLMVVAVAFYWVWDPLRAEHGEEKQGEKAAERGAALFATFCRVCHGDQGLGRLERTDLPGLPLNLPDNRPASPQQLEPLQARFNDTIRCGRVGTLMPPWHLSQGGALNDEQIRQLVVFLTTAGTPPFAYDRAAKAPAEKRDAERSRLEARITDDAEKAWHRAQEAANHTDDTGKRLVNDLRVQDTTIAVSDSKDLQRGGIIRLENELLEIVEIRGNELTVERGLRGTKPADHAANAPIYGPPIDPPTGPLNEDACGQIARSAAVTPPTTPIGVPVSGAIDVEMGDNFFVYQGQRQPNIPVQPGTEITVNLANKGQAIHNMRIAGLDDRYDTRDDFVSNPDTMRAGAKGTLKFKLDKTGGFKFRCDFHPDVMTGAITAQ